MNRQQALIDEEFKGNAALFEAAIADSRRYALQWRDVEESATVLPEWEAAALDVIEQRLGWLPHASSRLRYEPYLRALLRDYRSGAMTEAAFSTQVDTHLQLIRNEEMSENTCPTYDAEVYRSYATYLPQQREAARSRVTQFLGYAPDLQHSLVAELWLRKMLADDSFHLPAAPTAIDWKVLSLIQYREALLAEGKAAADASPLLPGTRAAPEQP